ncbi:endonuclease/exonuclease/phosphatase family protein [Mycolicibacterium komossense]|uniref:Endonuclease/exonuclease/phosphatase family protein n=1 Tax=Mycolicibacterium komossense TaxID=1779 RepID=A0ABT3CDJ3_9MYCO|nr:endonuclease/exonuclease/phosphatase family protein [Mycolicibacterium komossense]MCV7227526.1 endonuclease/exonuclease/phosphatase family protein [Mycolicibacterium komossense]
MQAHRAQLSRRINVRRSLATAMTVAVLAYSVIAVVVRARPLSNLLGLVVAVGSPYVPLAALVALALAIRCRRVLLAVVAASVVIATLAVQFSWYYLSNPVDVGQHIDIRVLSSNLRKGQADASVFVALAKQGADVVTVSELTPAAVRAFAHAGMDDTFPYSVLIPEKGAAGFGLWSRFPVTEVRLPKHRNTGIAAARLDVPGVRFDPLIASIHIMSPVASDQNSFAAWQFGIDGTKQELTDFASDTDPGAVIVAGDFNSTPDMRQFRDLATNGYRDAVDQTGAGFTPTFPSNEWFPPLITIDHVLTRNAAAASIKTVEMPGSDHRSLLATVRIPLDPTTP